MAYKNTAHHNGSGIVYHDGNRPREISYSQLKEIRSRVVTHEGETLSGAAGRKYMDNHAEKCLGKKLEGSYKDTSVRGYVK